MNSQFHFNSAELQKELYLLQAILAPKENKQSLNTPSHHDTLKNETATKSLILIAVFMRKLNEKSFADRDVFVEKIFKKQTLTDTEEEKRQQNEEIISIFDEKKCGTIIVTSIMTSKEGEKKESEKKERKISFLQLCNKVIHAYTYHYAYSITMTGENPNNETETKWKVTFDINQFAEITLLILEKIQVYYANS